MSTVMDLGFWLAKCDVTNEKESLSQLYIVEPGNDETEPREITITGLEAIVALRNCIDDEIDKAMQRAELAREDIPQ